MILLRTVRIPLYPPSFIPSTRSLLNERCPHGAINVRWGSSRKAYGVHTHIHTHTHTHTHIHIHTHIHTHIRTGGLAASPHSQSRALRWDGIGSVLERVRVEAWV
jgi:hypothetical protein